MVTTVPRRGLYALVDTGALARAGKEPIEFARAVLAGGPAVLQLRAKETSARDTLALLRALVPLARAAGVPLFANDRPDLAMLAGCDGVHVGQDDLPVEDVRRMAPGLLVGISTHDDAQVDAALAAAPDYLAFGPVFATATKLDASPVVGPSALLRVVARAGCPVVAIGGIDLERASVVAAAGALGAVIGALVVDDVTARARELSRALGSR